MKLIINADDAGIDPARNVGIFECIDHGVVSSISVIVGQAGWQDVLSRLKNKPRPNLSVGLHFNLTAGNPLVSGHKTLAAPDGKFLNKNDLLQKANSGSIDEREVIRELTAQLAALSKEGIEPTHIDGHNHVHILPGVREGFLKMELSNLWVRLPWERSKEVLDPHNEPPELINNDTQRYIKVMNFYSMAARQIWGNKFRYTDDFGGTQVTWQVTLSAFKAAVSGLKGDICELMCHPGGKPDNLSGPFSKVKERQLERDVLASAEFSLFLKASNISPQPFSKN